MSKKLKAQSAKTSLKVMGAFSLVELTISMIVIAIILAVLTPIISKRLTASSAIKNRISTDCDSFYPDGFCAMCYITPKKCITCTKNCNDNQYKNVGNCSCEDCSHKYSDIHCSRCNSKRCLQCDNGYYLDDNNRCVVCPLGHYCYQNAESSVKEACPVGTANNKTGQSVCTDCVKSDNTTTGSIALNKGMKNCESCSAGKYARNARQSTLCEDCPIGYYCPAGKLIPCPLGYMNGAIGAVSCIKCTKSSAYVTGSVATSEAMTSCRACGNGSYAAVEAQTTNCTTCPAGYYCPQGKIIPCPAGYYCPANSAAPIPCRANQTSSAGSSGCVNCATGCSTCSITAGNCTGCIAGYYKNGSSCNQCQAGYYCVGGTAGMTPCPAGTTSAAGASYCKSCSDFGTKCISCSVNGCTRCAQGYKVEGTGCKISFDCAAAGGSVTGNLCWKIIPNCSIYNLNYNAICGGNGWRAPSDLEMCTLNNTKVTTFSVYTTSKTIHVLTFRATACSFYSFDASENKYVCTTINHGAAQPYPRRHYSPAPNCGIDSLYSTGYKNVNVTCVKTIE